MSPHSLAVAGAGTGVFAASTAFATTAPGAASLMGALGIGVAASAVEATSARRVSR